MSRFRRIVLLMLVFTMILTCVECQNKIEKTEINPESTHEKIENTQEKSDDTNGNTDNTNANTDNTEKKPENTDAQSEETPNTTEENNKNSHITTEDKIPEDNMLEEGDKEE